MLTPIAKSDFYLARKDDGILGGTYSLKHVMVLPISHSRQVGIPYVISSTLTRFLPITIRQVAMWIRITEAANAYNP